MNDCSPFDKNSIFKVYLHNRRGLFDAQEMMDGLHLEQIIKNFQDIQNEYPDGLIKFYVHDDYDDDDGGTITTYSYDVYFVETDDEYMSRIHDIALREDKKRSVQELKERTILLKLQIEQDTRLRNLENLLVQEIESRQESLQQDFELFLSLKRKFEMNGETFPFR